MKPGLALLQSMTTAACTVLLGTGVVLAHGRSTTTVQRNGFLPGVTLTQRAAPDLRSNAALLSTQGKAGIAPDSFPLRTTTVLHTMSVRASSHALGSRMVRNPMGIKVTGPSSASGKGSPMGVQSPQTPAVTVHRSALEWVISIALVLFTAGLGVLLLWRHRSDLTTLS